MLVTLPSFARQRENKTPLVTDTIPLSDGHFKSEFKIFLVYSDGHVTFKGVGMATGSINNKSQKVSVRIPHETVDGIESTKELGESTGQFIVTALEGEIKRRQRKKSKDNPDQ